jgi:hypothetical protein
MVMLAGTTPDRETSMRLIYPSALPVLCLLATLSLAGGAAAAQVSTGTVTFSIADATDPAEVTEATTVFVNGKLVAHFELSATHPFDEVEVTVPEAPHYDYALCGRITILAADGHSETHVLDDGATLTDPAGRHLEALAADGFTTFYLGERIGDAGTPAPKDLHRTNVCSIPIS